MNSGFPRTVTDTWDITDDWRRAFDIGIGTAEGTCDDNDVQGQSNAIVRSRLGANIGGFDAAEAIQFERTRYGRRFHGKDPLSASSILELAGAVMESDRQEDTAIARDAQVVIRSLERRSDVVSLNDSVTKRNLSKWKQIMTKRKVPIFAIHAGDEAKRTNPISSQKPATAN